MVTGAPQSFREQLIALLSQVMQSSELPLLAGQGLNEYADKIAKHASLITWHDEGRLRAFIAFYCNDPSAEVAFVTMLVVDPVVRRRGVASILTRAAIAAIDARGFKCCRLNVNVRNLAAIRFYEGLAFKRLETEGAQHTYELRLRD